MNIELEHALVRANNPVLAIKANIRMDDEDAIVGLFGCSGAGKTSILKIIAGLIPGANCTIEFDGKTFVNTRGEDNPCVYLGADSPLFDHLNVHDNLALVARHSRSRLKDSFSVDELIAMCELAPLLRQFPWQLSSGEKQRVCFARAILSGKKILLLDEAFSALDWTTRQAMHLRLKRLVIEHHYSAIMVSHSLKELSLCVSELISVEQGAVRNQTPIDIALEHQMQLAQGAVEQDFFSVISAEFSHIDEQDAALQVWKVPNADITSLDANKALIQEQAYVHSILYVKAKGAVDDKTPGKQTGLGGVSPIVKESRAFVISANQLSVSRDENQQSSMVNYFPVVISDIREQGTGVLLSATWHKQTLRAMITLKSLKTLDIKVNDALYFVCKAL